MTARARASSGTFDLGSAWPVVAPRLARVLQYRGVDPSRADDLVQETATRVLRSAMTFPSEDDCFRWARRVAINLSIADYRRSSRVVSDEEFLLDVPERFPLEERVAARIALNRVFQLLRTLPVATRAAVLAPVTRSDRATDSGSTRNRRQRARRLLIGLAEDVFVFLGFKFRRFAPMANSPQVAQVALSGALVVGYLIGAQLDLPVLRDPVVRVVSSAIQQPEVQGERQAQSTGPPLTGAPQHGNVGRVRTQLPSAPSIELDHGGEKRVLVKAPTIVPGPEGRVTKNDDDEADDLRFCTTDFPLVGTGCPVTFTPPPVSPSVASPGGGDG